MQFCVHSDKQELIQSLTENLRCGADYSAVLYQVAEAIAQGKYIGTRRYNTAGLLSRCLYPL